MNNNNFMMIILAFILGYMIKSMCGGRFVEGIGGDGKTCDPYSGILSFDSACKGDREAVSCDDQKVHECCGSFMNACGSYGGSNVCVPTNGCPSGKS